VAVDVKGLIQELVQEYGSGSESLLPILQRIQEEKGFIAKEDAWVVSEQLGIPLIEIYKTVTFYELLWIGKRADYEIRVCGSISCAVNGGNKIYEAIVTELDIDSSGLSRDGRFFVEKVSCLGRCDESPAMMINDKVYTGLTPEKAREIVRELKEK